MKKGFLEKEAFALITDHLWYLLQGNEPVCPKLSGTLNSLEPKQFRPAVARKALEGMVDTFGEAVTVQQASRGKRFLEDVALAFATVIEGKRRETFRDLTEHAFAEILVLTFCTLYILFDATCRTDAALATCKSVMVLTPADEEDESLRVRLQQMEVEDFGAYALPPDADPKIPELP